MKSRPLLLNLHTNYFRSGGGTSTLDLVSRTLAANMYSTAKTRHKARKPSSPPKRHLNREPSINRCTSPRPSSNTPEPPYFLIGMPSPTGGGLTLSATLSPASFSLSSVSSALVSLFRKLLSLTGLPFGRPPALLWCTMLPLPLPPWLALPTPGEDRCGMFSGSGCCEPTLPVSTELALPALESA